MIQIQLMLQAIGVWVHPQPLPGFIKGVEQIGHTIRR